MESKLPAPNRSPEGFPFSTPQSIEYQPRSVTPERLNEQKREQNEKKGETAPSENLRVVLPPPAVAPQPSVTQLTTTGTNPPTDDAPLVANDDDLIEREWVDKAKKIIAETKDDPYKREHDLALLQADYLRKRYGRELGASQ